ncbi:MAG: hypothetical protein AAFN27_19250 [Pseudomonadota bacterium]
MGFSPVFRSFGAVAVIASILAVAGCDQRGFSATQAEWERRKGQQFYVVSASPNAAIVNARGQDVAIRPADGFCLSRESIETSNRSAVALIGDCALQADAATTPKSERGELKLPPALPGIITVSISGEAEQAGLDIDDLSTFLESPQGRSLIGRSSDGSGVSVTESRRIGNAVYVLVKDENAGPVPILSDTFWRAFIEVKDRLAVVTINGFRDRPLGVERMLGYLSDQVEAIQQANAGGLGETRRLIADSTPIEAERIASTEAGALASNSEDVERLSDLRPTIVITANETQASEGAQGGRAPDDDLETESATAEATAEHSEITIEESITVPAGDVVVPLSRPSTTAAQTARLVNPASTVDRATVDSADADAEAPVTAPRAPKRRKRT